MTSAGNTSQAQTSSAEAEVKDMINEAQQQVKESQDKIHKARRETEEDAEQIQKDQRFQRVKDALDLKEQGHKLDPSAVKEHDDAHGDIEAKADASRKAQPPNDSKDTEADSRSNSTTKADKAQNGPMSKEERTRENAASEEAQVPDGTISKSICQRLLALEAKAAARPRRKLVSKGEPVPQLAHHYAAAAWWAVA